MINQIDLKKFMNTQGLLLGLIIVWALLSMFYTVHETQKAIVLRLGKLIKDGEKIVVKDSGLYFRVPFIDEVRKFDTRLNLLDIKSSRIVTNEKKDVLVDFYVEWRIEDLALFYTRTQGDKNKAEVLLSQKSIDGLRAEFGKSSIKEVVSGVRMELMEKLKKFTDHHAGQLGIEVIDVRIKRIDLPDEVSGAVYARMSSERARVASELKAQGEADAIVIRANANKTRRVLLAEAKQAAQDIHGTGDATATKIYADSYSKAPQFFELYKSLNAYKKSFSKEDDILLLKPDNDFFKYFGGSSSSGANK